MYYRLLFVDSFPLAFTEAGDSREHKHYHEVGFN